MAKRYLGGGISFEQKDVYQEFSEDEGGGGGGGSTTLAGLTDVDITDPTDGQTLVYNAESGKWENGVGGGAGLVVNVTYDDEANTYTLDKTWKDIKDAMVSGGVAILISHEDYIDEFEIGEEWIIENITTIAYSTPVDSSSQNSYVIDTARLTYVTESENGYPQASGSS